MLIPRFEPTPVWWKRYAAFVAAVGARNDQIIQQAIRAARGEAEKEQPQVLQVVELALQTPDAFFAMFTPEKLTDAPVAKRAGAVLSFMPQGYQRQYQKQVSAAIVAVEAAHPNVAAAIFQNKVTRALADPELSTSATTLVQAEAQLLARMVMKQDYITALVQAGIVAADNAGSVMVDSLLLQNQRTIERVDARVLAGQNTFKHMYMLDHPDATLQDAQVRLAELEKLATTGPLRADSALRAQRAELGSLAGLATGAPFHNTLLSLSFWAVHNRELKETEMTELRSMVQGVARTSAGTCNYDTYLLPSIATSLFEKASQASRELQELINIKAVCTRFPMLFFSARAAEYSQDFIERVFQTYVTDVTLRFQLFDNYVSSLSAYNKFAGMTKIQMNLWYLLYETRRMNTLLAMQLLTQLYPAQYNKATAQNFVTQIQEHVRVGLSACESSGKTCGEYCVSVKTSSGVEKCTSALPDTLDVLTVPLLQTFSPGTNVQDQYQVSRLTNTRVPLPVDDVWVRQQAQLYGLEKPPPPAPGALAFLGVDQLVAMMCPAYTTTLLAWSIATVQRLDASSKVRQALQLLGAKFLKEQSVPTLKQQAAAARDQRLRESLQDKPTIVKNAITFVNHCQDTWEDVVTMLYSPETATDIVMGAYNSQLLLDELAKSNTTIYWLLNSTLSSLWKVLGLNTQTVSVASPVDATKIEFGVTGVKAAPRTELKLQLFALVAVTLTELALKIVVYFKSFVKYVNASVTRMFTNTFQWICTQVQNVYDYTTRVISERVIPGWTNLLTTLVSIVPTSIWELPRKMKSLYSLITTFDFRSFLTDIIISPWSFVNSLTTAVRKTYVLSTSMVCTSMVAALWLFETSVTGGAASASAEGSAALNATLPLLQAVLNSNIATTLLASNAETLGAIKTLIGLASKATINAPEVTAFVQTTLANSTVDLTSALTDTIATVLNTSAIDVAASAANAGMSLAVPVATSASGLCTVAASYLGQSVQVPALAAVVQPVSNVAASYLGYNAGEVAAVVQPVSNVAASYLGYNAGEVAAMVQPMTMNTLVNYLINMPSELAAASAPALESGVKAVVATATNVTAASASLFESVTTTAANVTATWAPSWTAADIPSAVATQLTNQLQCPLASPLDIIQSAEPAPAVTEVMTALQTVNVTNPLTAVTTNMTAEQITTALQQVPTDVSLVIPAVASLAAAALVYFIDKRSNGTLSGAVSRTASAATSSVGKLLSKASDMFGLRAKKQEEVRAGQTVQKTKYTKKQLKQVASKLQRSNAKENHRRRLSQERAEAAEARVREQVARERDDALAAAMANEDLQLREHEIQMLEAELEDEQDVPPVETTADELHAHYVQQAEALQALIDASADVALASGLPAQTVLPLRASLQHEVQTARGRAAEVVSEVARSEEVVQVTQQLNELEQAVITLEATIADAFAGALAESVVVAPAVAEVVSVPGPVPAPPIAEAREPQAEQTAITQLIELVQTLPLDPFGVENYDDKTFDQVFNSTNVPIVDKTLFIMNTCINSMLSRNLNAVAVLAAVWDWHEAKDKTLSEVFNALPVLRVQVIAALRLVQYIRMMNTNVSVQVQIAYYNLFNQCLESDVPVPIPVTGSTTLNLDMLELHMLQALFCLGFRQSQQAPASLLALWMCLAIPNLTYNTALQVAVQKQVTLPQNLIMLSLLQTRLHRQDIQSKLPLVVEAADVAQVAQLAQAAREAAALKLQLNLQILYKRRRVERLQRLRVLEQDAARQEAERTEAARVAAETAEAARVAAQAEAGRVAAEEAARIAAQEAAEAARVAAEAEAARIAAEEAEAARKAAEEAEAARVAAEVAQTARVAAEAEAARVEAEAAAARIAAEEAGRVAAEAEAARIAAAQAEAARVAAQAEAVRIAAQAQAARVAAQAQAVRVAAEAEAARVAAQEAEAARVAAEEAEAQRVAAEAEAARVAAEAEAARVAAQAEAARIAAQALSLIHI